MNLILEHRRDSKLSGKTKEPEYLKPELSVYSAKYLIRVICISQERCADWVLVYIVQTTS